MPGKARIDSIIDLSAVQKETSSVEQELNKLADLIKKMPQAVFALRNASDFESTNKATQNLVNTNKDLSNSTDAVAKAQQRLATAQSDVGKKVAEYNAQIQEQNKQNKAAALETLGLSGAYAQLQKQFNDAAKSAKDLAAQALIDPSKAQAAREAAAAANDFNNKLKAIDASVGQYQRNVGNYTGAVSILEKSLNDVRGSIDNFNKSGNQNKEVLQQLTKEEQLLQEILGQNVSGFASLAQELRANERALATMSEQGLQSTQAFKELRIDTANARRELNEFQKSQALLSSEVPALTALTSVAKGLGSAYAIGAGATALFGNSNEKLEKELNKLVAIMTLLQGLSEINNVLKEKEAILTALQTTGTRIATIAQNIWNATIIESIAATTALRIALIGLTGGLFLLLPILALGASKAEDIDTKLKKLPGTTDAVRNSLKEMGSTANDIAKGVLEKLNSDIKNLNDELKITPTTIEQANAALELLQQEASKTETNLNSFWQSLTRGVFAVNDLASLSDNFSNQLDLVNKIQEVKRKEFMKKEGEDLQNAFNANLENQKDEAALNIDKNNRILSNDKSTYSQKISALKDNLSQQRTLIHADLNKDLSDTSDPNIRTQKQKEANNKMIVAQRDFNTAIQKLNEEAAKKLVETVKDQFSNLADFSDALQQNTLDKLQAIATDENAITGLRIIALKKYEELKSIQIQSDAENEIAVNQYTAEKSLAVRQKASNEIIKLEADTAKTIVSIQRKAAEDAEKARQQQTENFEEKIFEIGDAVLARTSKNHQQQNKDEIDSEKAKYDAIKKAAEEAYTFIQTLVDANYERRINQIQDEINASNEKYNQEILNIQNSSLTDQQKTEQTIQLQEQQKIQEQRLTQQLNKEKEKEARVDRDAQVLEILGNTLLSASKAGWITPLAIAIEAIGALEIATLLAKPLPHYKDGLRYDKPDHFGLHGDVIEMVKKPGEDPFISTTPTIDFIPMGTRITPLNDGVNDDLYKGMIQQTARAITLTGYPKQNNDLNFEKALNKHADKVVNAILKNKPYIRRKDLSAIRGELILKNEISKWQNFR